MSIGSDARIDAEIQRVLGAIEQMLHEYEAWGERIKWGDVHFAFYSDLLDFCNFRMETAQDCLALIKAGRISGALGLNRSLLENYLLFALMCRGNKYYMLADCSSLTESEFKAKLKEEKEALKSAQEAGTATYLEVKKFPRAARHIMYVCEGLKDDSGESILVPVHYFEFRNFRPEVMRFRHDDYFEYYELEPDTKKILRQHQDRAARVYRFYLSYDSLIQCLELNGILDKAASLRVDAHYTFLGQFLHPTHDAARNLRANSNVHHGGTTVGARQPYSDEAILLSSLYLAHTVASFMREATNLLDAASDNYFSDTATGPLAIAADRTMRQFAYFWFIDNDPPPYNRWLHSIHHASDEEITAWGGYMGCPKESVSFDSSIFTSLKDALQGWNNARCGPYNPPF
ncbi:hypothetical protein GCM10023194_69360 [Planotetraspora phitsanulokensis]|uniref:Uncharacterized protein n=1 Tax=Planotetraspora phitsanulokensis TaxID=575192 RepID=A0A8J3XNQ3_9ACTN|nr:hypothetical protein [Planotetraspora phitsanulokensis]GII43083.1 hypothetical protein Pph01_80860 [Planotetraspora phitsanulokensis]